MTSEDVYLSVYLEITRQTDRNTHTHTSTKVRLTDISYLISRITIIN